MVHVENLLTNINGHLLTNLLLTSLSRQIKPMVDRYCTLMSFVCRKNHAFECQTAILCIRDECLI
jgi:hypothetical protein